MADTVTVRRSFKPGEILVEVVSVGLYGLTAAEVPIAPIAGLEASTVQGALEGINSNAAGKRENITLINGFVSASPSYVSKVYRLGNMAVIELFYKYSATTSNTYTTLAILPKWACPSSTVLTLFPTPPTYLHIQPTGEVSVFSTTVNIAMFITAAYII